MSRDEVPFSSHGADQAWFSMLLVNDPNTALVGALRPSRLHPLWVALRRPFERRVPRLEPAASDAVEQIPGLRPRPARWIGAGLVLAFGVTLAGGGWERAREAAATPMAPAAVQEERIGSTTLEARPAPAAELELNVPRASAKAPPAAPSASVQRNETVALAARVAPPAHAPSAAARKQRSATSPRASTASVPRATPVRKAAARRVRRAFEQRLARSR